MTASIPSCLPINESSRLLVYLKLRYQAGYFNKSEIKSICRAFGKDIRTIHKLLQTLVKENLIGETSTVFHLRSWKHITLIEGFNLQSFRASLSEVRNKNIFEAKLFGAKVTSIKKTILRGQVRNRGCTTQSPSTGLLSKICQVSYGKVSELKRLAIAQGFITIERGYDILGSGTKQSVNILRREMPGIFLCEGKLLKRKTDAINSQIETFRIKNRKPYKAKKGSTR